MIELSFRTCVCVARSQGTMCLWTWVGSHRSGWLTWVTPATLDASTATSDSAGSAVRLHIKHYIGFLWFMRPKVKSDIWKKEMTMLYSFKTPLSLCHSVHHFAGQKVHLSTEISQHLPKSAETQSCLTTSLLTLWCMICRLLMVFTLKLEQLEGVKGIWPHWQLLL